MQLIVESQFFPPIALFSELKKMNTVIIEGHEHYQKRSFRNKCMLTGANGKISFTVPLVKGKHQQLKIQDARISYDEDWIRVFIQLCQSNYRRSPYLIYIFDDILHILRKQHSTLYALNMELFNWIIEFLELEITVEESNCYISSYATALDLRHYWLPKHQLLNKKYPQVFEERTGFIQGLSILDLLFCCGKESVVYLEGI